MNGVICSVSNPDVYYTETPDGLKEHSRTAEMFHGNPGEDFQCRCSMVAWNHEIDGMYEVKDSEAEAKAEAERKAEALKKASEIRKEMERAIEYAEEAIKNWKIPQMGLQNSAANLRRFMKIIEQKIGWENLSDYLKSHPSDDKNLRGLISRTNEERIKWIAETRHRNRRRKDADEIALKWRREKSPFLFDKIKQTESLLDPIALNEGLKFMYELQTYTLLAKPMTMQIITSKPMSITIKTCSLEPPRNI